MFRSFILRLSQILTLTAVLCLLLMLATLFIQKQAEAVYFIGMIFMTILVWFLVNWYVVRKVDPEVSVEVARILFPSGAILSICLSGVLSLYLDTLIPGREGSQHLILPFVGVGVAFYLIVRCFDIKWLRGEDEINEMEDRESE
ncbi:MAG: hypothetical protein AB3N33_02840 [Puniceicoccaceae bacterium]